MNIEHVLYRYVSDAKSERSHVHVTLAGGATLDGVIHDNNILDDVLILHGNRVSMIDARQVVAISWRRKR